MWITLNGTVCQGLKRENEAFVKISIKKTQEVKFNETKCQPKLIFAENNLRVWVSAWKLIFKEIVNITKTYLMICLRTKFSFLEIIQNAF